MTGAPNVAPRLDAARHFCALPLSTFRGQSVWVEPDLRDGLAYPIRRDAIHGVGDDNVLYRDIGDHSPMPFGDARFGRGDKAGPHDSDVSAQCQRTGHTCAVGDTAAHGD